MAPTALFYSALGLPGALFFLAADVAGAGRVSLRAWTVAPSWLLLVLSPLPHSSSRVRHGPGRMRRRGPHRRPVQAVRPARIVLPSTVIRSVAGATAGSS
jgi:hypothetical protein